MPAPEAAKVKVLTSVKCRTMLDRIRSVGVREERNTSLVCFTNTKISNLPTRCFSSSYVKVSSTCDLYFRNFGLIYCLHL